MPDITKCSVEGCDHEARTRGMCQAHYMKVWAKERKEKPKPPSVPVDLAAQVANARTSEDWQRIAAQVQGTLQGILDGTIKATAPQVSLLKDILNRAFGKPSATQEERHISAGVVVLPTFGSNATMMMCPKCGYDIAKGGDNLAERVMIAVAEAAHATKHPVGA